MTSAAAFFRSSKPNKSCWLFLITPLDTVRLAGSSSPIYCTFTVTPSKTDRASQERLEDGFPLLWFSTLTFGLPESIEMHRIQCTDPRIHLYFSARNTYITTGQWSSIIWFTGMHYVYILCAIIQNGFGPDVWFVGNKMKCLPK